MWRTVNNKRNEDGFEINYQCDFCFKKTTVLAVIPDHYRKMICKDCLTKGIKAIDRNFEEGFKK